MPRVPGHPTARLSSAPMQFDGTGLEIRRRAPEIGEHTDEVFREIGVDAGRDRTAARELRSAGVRSPVPKPQMIWAVGLNYRAHAAETGRPLPEFPTLFVKSPRSVIAHDDTDRRAAARHAARLRRRARGRDRATRVATSRVDDALDVRRGRHDRARRLGPRPPVRHRPVLVVEVVRHVLPARSGSRVARRGRSRGRARARDAAQRRSDAIVHDGRSRVLVPQLIAWITQGMHARRRAT